MALRRSQRIQQLQLIQNPSESSDSETETESSSDSSSLLSEGYLSSDSTYIDDIMTTVFETNPFAGNINPATTTGLKLYQSATADRSDESRLSLSIAKSSQFLDAMKADATKFSWGKLTSTISIEGSNRDILKDFKHVDVEKVRLRMNPVFKHRTDVAALPTGDLVAFAIDPAVDDADKPIFYSQVRANMIGLRILGSLNESSLKSLKLKEKLYLWEDVNGTKFYDGPTMLQLCIEKVNPSTRVGVSKLKEVLRSVKASSYDYNVGDLTDKMDATYREIVQRGSTHDDYVMDLFNVLLSNKNTIFTDFIQREKDKWDTGAVIDPDVLITEAVTKYDNMVATSEWTVVEPGTSKIAALTTELNELKEKFVLVTQNMMTGSQSHNSNPSGGSRRNDSIPAWRFAKTLGDKVERDGKTWHWCHHQHNNGKGMYVTHHPDNHVQWKERKDREKKERAAATKDSAVLTPAPPHADSKKTLALSDNLKAAMVAKFRCTDSDAEKLWTDVVKSSN